LITLSVSIVLHDSAFEWLEETLLCLERAIIEAQQANLLQAHIFLIDNNSRPEYRAALPGLVQSLEALQGVSTQLFYLPKNVGFGAGHNHVLPALHSDVHLILNPDAFCDEQALCAGLSLLESESSIVLLSPRALGSTGQIEYLCKRHPSVFVLLLRGFAPRALQRRFSKRLEHYEMRDKCSSQESVDVDIASGCFMLVRTTALQAVGGFEESYFLYFEDFDLSLRLQRLGRLVFSPQMVIVHHGGNAARKGFAHVKYFVTSGIRFFNRHGWRWL